MQTVGDLGADVGVLAKSLAEICEHEEVASIEDLPLITAHEMYGVLIDKANRFIQTVQTEEDTLKGLDALKQIQAEVTLFLHNVRREFFNGQETSDT
jgi:hypothetical protein